MIAPLVVGAGLAEHNKDGAVVEATGDPLPMARRTGRFGKVMPMSTFPVRHIAG